MTSDDKYTPNMEKLKADLGRVPPTMVVQGKPEDFAPKPRINKPPYIPADQEAEIAQRIKAVMRESADWERLTWNAREGLDTIASKVAGICVGRDYWEDISQGVAIVQQSENQEP